MKKILALMLVLIMSVAMLSGCGEKTESDLAYIEDKGEMIIGITLFAPMNYYEGEELIGFETEFAKAVCEKLGVEPKFVEINWDAKETELAAKNIDCIWNGMTITDERKENMSVTEPYMSNKQILVTKAENADKMAGAIGAPAISVEQGSSGETVANENALFADAAVTAVDSQAKALMEVKAGNADGAVVDYVMSIGSIGEGTDYEDLALVDVDLNSDEDYGIAFRKGSDVTAKVNEIIAGLVEDGTMDEIASKYKLQDLIAVK